MDKSNPVVARVKAAMKARKLTMTALSERSGVPYRTLQNQLGGKNKLTVEVLSRVTAVIDPMANFADGRHASAHQIDVALFDDCRRAACDLGKTIPAIRQLAVRTYNAVQGGGAVGKSLTIPEIAALLLAADSPA